MLMLGTIIFISIWIHYTQAMMSDVNAALDVLGDGTAADNFNRLSQSVTATSILYFIYGAVMYGLCLWWTLLELEADQIGQVKDKLQLYMMANLGVRVCWWAVMTWMVLLLAGAAIFGVYTSNITYMITTVLNNQAMVGGYPEHLGPYPECPATCLDLWRIDYIDTPMNMSCVCNREALLSALTFTTRAKNNIAGSLVGVFFMYIIGGYWRSELARHYATCRTMQDVSGRLAKGGLEGGGAPVAASGRSAPARGRPGGGRGGGGGDSDAYRPLAGGPGPGRGIGRGRGRREAG
ncbi:hypothetical protein HYH02_007926 [Chlamydomonas schloesseri]|uniref:Uncharacterized protein n=1 Tax=Chlamydomonas schloesseri TaxID=2026947 RepID=A0A835WH11_9CHLO|nr:hypothetical protein HYH02_007926 [Chlamydomonas schloesseri]|eukprot:KAG2447183.1 hypothetical protein HYH02_007926 [Chlamydomonas schloesseri]